MTAQLDGVESAQPTTPTPTAMYAQWFPAAVQLPDGTAPHTVRVFATDAGLYVFAARPADGDLSSAAFFSPIDWPATLAVQPRLPQPRVGFVIVTEAGPVSVARMAGCGCHHRSLKSWVPAWTGRSLPWGDSQ